MTEHRHLRLAETSGRRRGLPRLRVKIAVSTDCVPYGQSRQFHIRERGSNPWMTRFAGLPRCKEHLSGGGSMKSEPFDPTDLDYYPPGEPIDFRTWRGGQRSEPPTSVEFKTLADFCREYVPLDYSIEGLL